MEQQENTYIGYEYKEVTGEGSLIPLLMDSYESFGWEITEQTKLAQDAAGQYKNRETLRLRRDRHIINKVELTRLQRNFEAYINEIGQLEKAKTTKATVYSLVLGLIGTAFMAGSVFAVTATPPLIILTILLAIPAFMGWIFPYFIYKKVVEKETLRINPIIESKYDEIDALCEKGHKLTQG